MVLAVIALLAGLVLPGLARARARAEGIVCLNNLRQLQIAFHTYADDHNDELSPAETQIALPNMTRWVDGIMHPFFAQSLNEMTNRQMMLAPGPGHLGPYLPAAGVFHCPSDRSTTNFLRTRGPLRARSYTMNPYMVLGDGVAYSMDGPWQYSKTAFVKWSDFSRVSPSQIWVFLDEHPVTIKNGAFELLWTLGPSYRWSGRWPARRHGGQGTLSFADGHVELHKWVDPRTGPPVKDWAEAFAFGWSVPGSRDYEWMWERTNGPWPDLTR